MEPKKFIFRKGFYQNLNKSYHHDRTIFQATQNTGGIVGGIIAVIVVVALALGMYSLYRRKRNNRYAKFQTGPNSFEYKSLLKSMNSYNLNDMKSNAQIKTGNLKEASPDTYETVNPDKFDNLKTNGFKAYHLNSVYQNPNNQAHKDPKLRIDTSAYSMIPQGESNGTQVMPQKSNVFNFLNTGTLFVQSEQKQDSANRSSNGNGLLQTVNKFFNNPQQNAQQPSQDGYYVTSYQQLGPLQNLEANQEDFKESLSVMKQKLEYLQTQRQALETRSLQQNVNNSLRDQKHILMQGYKQQNSSQKTDNPFLQFTDFSTAVAGNKNTKAQQFQPQLNNQQYSVQQNSNLDNSINRNYDVNGQKYQNQPYNYSDPQNNNAYLNNKQFDNVSHNGNYYNYQQNNSNQDNNGSQQNYGSQIKYVNNRSYGSQQNYNGQSANGSNGNNYVYNNSSNHEKSNQLHPQFYDQKYSNINSRLSQSPKSPAHSSNSPFYQARNSQTYSRESQIRSKESSTHSKESPNKDLQVRSKESSHSAKFFNNQQQKVFSPNQFTASRSLQRAGSGAGGGKFFDQNNFNTKLDKDTQSPYLKSFKQQQQYVQKDPILTNLQDLKSSSKKQSYNQEPLKVHFAQAMNPIQKEKNLIQLDSNNYVNSKTNSREEGKRASQSGRVSRSSDSQGVTSDFSLKEIVNLIDEKLDSSIKASNYHGQDLLNSDQNISQSTNSDNLIPSNPNSQARDSQKFREGSLVYQTIDEEDQPSYPNSAKHPDSVKDSSVMKKRGSASNLTSSKSRESRSQEMKNEDKSMDISLGATNKESQGSVNSVQLQGQKSSKRNEQELEQNKNNNGQSQVAKDLKKVGSRKSLNDQITGVDQNSLGQRSLEDDKILDGKNEQVESGSAKGSQKNKSSGLLEQHLAVDVMSPKICTNERSHSERKQSAKFVDNNRKQSSLDLELGKEKSNISRGSSYSSLSKEKSISKQGQEGIQGINKGLQKSKSRKLSEQSVDKIQDITSPKSGQEKSLSRGSSVNKESNNDGQGTLKVLQKSKSRNLQAEKPEQDASVKVEKQESEKAKDSTKPKIILVQDQKVDSSNDNILQQEKALQDKGRGLSKSKSRKLVEDIKLEQNLGSHNNNNLDENKGNIAASQSPQLESQQSDQFKDKSLALNTGHMSVEQSPVKYSMQNIDQALQVNVNDDKSINEVINQEDPDTPKLNNQGLFDKIDLNPTPSPVQKSSSRIFNKDYKNSDQSVNIFSSASIDVKNSENKFFKAKFSSEKDITNEQSRKNLPQVNQVNQSSDNPLRDDSQENNFQTPGSQANFPQNNRESFQQPTKTSSQADLLPLSKKAPQIDHGFDFNQQNNQQQQKREITFPDIHADPFQDNQGNSSNFYAPSTLQMGDQNLNEPNIMFGISNTPQVFIASKSASQSSSVTSNTQKNKKQDSLQNSNSNSRNKNNLYPNQDARTPQFADLLLPSNANELSGDQVQGTQGISLHPEVSFAQNLQQNNLGSDIQPEISFAQNLGNSQGPSILKGAKSQYLDQKVHKPIDRSITLQKQPTKSFQNQDLEKSDKDILKRIINEKKQQQAIDQSLDDTDDLSQKTKDQQLLSNYSLTGEGSGNLGNLFKKIAEGEKKEQGDFKEWFSESQKLPQIKVKKDEQPNLGNSILGLLGGGEKPEGKLTPQSSIKSDDSAKQMTPVVTPPSFAVPDRGYGSSGVNPINGEQQLQSIILPQPIDEYQDTVNNSINRCQSSMECGRDSQIRHGLGISVEEYAQSFSDNKGGRKGHYFGGSGGGQLGLFNQLSLRNGSDVEGIKRKVLHQKSMGLPSIDDSVLQSNTSSNSGQGKSQGGKGLRRMMTFSSKKK